MVFKRKPKSFGCIDKDPQYIIMLGENAEQLFHTETP